MNAALLPSPRLDLKTLSYVSDVGPKILTREVKIAISGGILTLFGSEVPEAPAAKDIGTARRLTRWLPFRPHPDRAVSGW